MTLPARLAIFCLLLGSSSAFADPFSHDPAVVLDEALAFQDLLDQRRRASADDKSDDDDDLGERDSQFYTLLREVRVDIDDEGVTRFVERAVYVPRTQGAVEALGTLDIEFAPWREDRPEIDARVIGLDGSVSVLDPASIQVAGSGRTDRLILSDEQRLRAPLPNLRPGSVIEIVERRVMRPLLDGAGGGGALRLSDSYSVGKIDLQVEGPATRALRVSVRGEPPAELKREKLGKGRIRYAITVDDVIPTPDRESPTPLTPVPEPELAWSFGPSWDDLARLYQAQTDPLLTADGLADWVEAVKAAPTGRKAKVERAMALMRERNRYTGVEFGQQAIIPYKPAETVERGFGDCKDRASLLVVLLREVGIPAHLALILSREGPDVPVDHPSLGAFDHAIVYLPPHQGEPGVFVDATADYFPYGAVPGNLYGKSALVIGLKGSALVQVPVPPAANSGDRYTSIWSYEDPDILRLTHVTAPWGEIAGWIRAGWDREGGTERKRGIEQDLKERIKATEIEVNWTDPRDVTQPFQSAIAYASPSERPGYEPARRVQLPAHETLKFLPNWVVNAPDKHDPIDALADGERTAFKPYRREREIVIRLPKGLDIEPPPAIDEQIGPMRFTVSGEWIEPSVWSQRAVLDAGDGRLTADEVRAFRDFVRDGAFSDHTLTLGHPGAVHDFADRLNDAWPAYRTTSPPQGFEHGYRLGIAGFLFQLGFDEPARAELAKADAADPWMRFRAFSYDPDNRPPLFRDRAKGDAALAMYRELREADPDDRLDLTDQLERTLWEAHAGAPWSQREGYLREMLGIERKKPDDDNAFLKTMRETRRADALATLGDYPEALKALREAKGTQRPTSLALGLLVKSDGIEALNRRASSLSRGAATRERDGTYNGHIFTAIDQLLAWRDYDTARELAELLKDDPNEQDDRRRIRAMVAGARATTGDYKHVSNPLRSVFLALDPIARSGEDLAERFVTDPGERRGLELMGALRQAASTGSRHSLIALELVAGAASVTRSEGNDRATRLTVEIAGKPFSVYMIKERGRWAVVDIGQAGTASIAQAAAALERGDRQTARQWAEFLRQDARAAGRGTQRDDLPAALIPEGADDATIARAITILAARSHDLAWWDRAIATLPELSQAQRDAAFPGLMRAFTLLDLEHPTRMLKPEARDRRTGLYEMALTLELSPLNESMARMFLAGNYEYVNRPADALELLSKPLLEASMERDARVVRARLKIPAGDTPGALAALEAEWSAREAQGDINNTVWAWLLAGGDPVRARDALLRNLGTQRLTRENLAVHHTLALAALYAGDYDRAADITAKAASVFRGDDDQSSAWALIRGGLALHWADPDLAEAAFADSEGFVPWEADRIAEQLRERVKPR